MTRRCTWIWTVLLLLPLTIEAQTQELLLTKAHHFSKAVPAADYSGIAWIGGNRYAVVDDKSERNGFYLFEVEIDTARRRLTKVECVDFVATDDAANFSKRRDAEGIAYLPHLNTLLIAGEADGRIIEYTLDGHPTGREVALPPMISNAVRNKGLESLSYQAATQRLWTCTEGPLPGDGTAATATNGACNRIRLMAFDGELIPCGQYAYLMDAPHSHKAARTFAIGISELCALPDGSLLVMERETRVPKRKIGSYVINKLYRVWPEMGIMTNADAPLTDNTPYLEKTLMAQWRTRLNLTRRNYANYEGMTAGPLLNDGSLLLLLVSDSQHHYGGILKDWFRLLIME